LQRFTGTFEHALDGKHRVAIPRKILEVLKALDAADKVVVTAGLDGCLGLYTPAEFERMSDKVDEGSMGEQGVRDFSRRFYSLAESCPVDKTGRMVLPAPHRQLIGLAEEGGRVVFVGVGKRVELWEPQAWAEHEARTADQYEQQAKDVFR